MIALPKCAPMMCAINYCGLTLRGLCGIRRSTLHLSRKFRKCLKLSLQTFCPRCYLC